MNTLTCILIAAMLFCIFQIIIQIRKMNSIEQQYKKTKLQQKEEKQYL